MTTGYRAVAPDQRGYSPYARPVMIEDYAIEHLESDVIALANALEMDTFDLVGHDWGGLIAWLVATRQPERVRSLSVVSTPHPLALQEVLLGPGRRDHGDRRVPGYMDSFRELAIPERLLLGEDNSGAGLLQLLAEVGLEGPLAEEYVQAMAEPGALTAALNWYRAMDGRRRSRTCSRWRCPPCTSGRPATPRWDERRPSSRLTGSSASTTSRCSKGSLTGSPSWPPRSSRSG